MGKQHFDTIVLGLGAIGSVALYWLSRRLGGDVLGVEQFEIGHIRGDRRTIPASSASPITIPSMSTWPSMPMRRGKNWKLMRKNH